MDTSANSSSILNFIYLCAISAESTTTFKAWFVVYMAICPLFLLVLFIGLSKWCKQRNDKSVSLNHSDVFTYHMMALELILISAAAMFLYGLCTRKDTIATSGITMLTLNVSGQTYFHCLTCVERYLAVVHPITYLRLKKKGGVTIRNISIGVAWFLSFSYMAVVSLIPHYFAQIVASVLFIVSSIVPMTFCSISALCVLIRPGPGNRKRLDQTKWSAFITITAILGVLLLRMVQLVVFNFSFVLVGLDPCVLSLMTFWLILPSSLVLPLLFLHRSAKQTRKQIQSNK